MHSIRRYLRIRVVTADMPNVISHLAQLGIEVRDVILHDPLTAELEITYSQFSTLEKYLSGKNIVFKIVHKEGWLWLFERILRRPVLITGMAAFLLISLLVPNYVLFVRVEGNEKLADSLILSQADLCGVRFGSRRRDVRSEQIKNALLEAIPQLQWVGVNTTGCVATIHVRERNDGEASMIGNGAICSIVATQGGVISQLTVLNGTAQCGVGQQVAAGDLLISGYTDCGRTVRAECARGEVYAYTRHKNIVIAPKPIAQKGKEQEKHASIILRIGKKLLNIWKDSGIHGVTCDKMYFEYDLTLPGGFQLPVSLILCTCTTHEAADAFASSAEPQEWICGFSKEYLQDHMIAGQIFASGETLTEEADHYLLVGDYACNEMIGQVRNEETLDNYAEDY